MVKQADVDQLNELIKSIETRYQEIRKQAEIDVEIDEIDLDRSLLDLPKLHAKYLNLFTENTLFLKDLFSLANKTKLERWKYLNGKSTDKYYADHGPVHEKILKTDLDKYMAADEKIKLVNDAIAHQKGLTEYIEQTMKELRNRSFHVKAIIDWRRFQSGS